MLDYGILTKNSLLFGLLPNMCMFKKCFVLSKGVEVKLGCLEGRTFPYSIVLFVTSVGMGACVSKESDNFFLFMFYK